MKRDEELRKQLTDMADFILRRAEQAEKRRAPSAPRPRHRPPQTRLDRDPWATLAPLRRRLVGAR